MIKNKSLAKLDICRRCLNTYSKLDFKNYELKYKYYYYHSECSNCGRMNHIVKAVRPLYMPKLLLVNIPDSLIMDTDPDYEKAKNKKKRRRKIKKWFGI